MSRKGWLRGSLFAVSLILLGGLSSLLAPLLSGRGIAAIYEQIKLPVYAPPRWLFGPAWTLLYALLGFYLAHIRGNRSLQKVMYSQMILNLCWTPVFFGIEQYGLAVLMILVMDILVVWLIIQEKTPYRVVLIVYLSWLCYASYLAIGVFLLNR